MDLFNFQINWALLICWWHFILNLFRLGDKEWGQIRKNRVNDEKSPILSKTSSVLADNLAVFED
jgi:hypothetical protein